MSNRKRIKLGLTYSSLRDVSKSVNQKVNVIGVVLETSFAKETTGTDECCILRIIDDTHHDVSMSVNVFSENIQRLPLVAALGDVIQLIDFVVNLHNGEVNIVYKKSSSSFALYKGKDGDDLDPYQVSSRFYLRRKDKMLIDRMRKWLINFKLVEDSSKFPMFREFKEDTYINLACKIIYHNETANDELFIFAWDGSDLQPNVIRSNLEDELKHSLPLQLEHLPLPRGILCTFPTMGSIIRITFEQGIHKSHLHLLCVGQWVKFTNLRLKVDDGLWHGIFTLTTKVRYVQNEDQLILERQRLSDERLSLISQRMHDLSFPQPLSITVNYYNRMTPVTLMSVLTHSEVTAIFKCVVRVVAATPYQAELLCSPTTGRYNMRLTLEDSTARIHAYVSDEDGETLFDGYPGPEKVRMKLKKLLGTSDSDGSNDGVKGALRNPPWVCICLKSYYLSKDDIWGSRNFRVFGTKIMEDSS